MPFRCKIIVKSYPDAPYIFYACGVDMSAMSSGLDAYSAHNIYTRRDNNPILLGRVEHNADIYIYKDAIPAANIYCINFSLYSPDDSAPEARVLL